MFSIIIPLFNKEHSIKSTIESVLSQTYKDFEIIVIDDGSTDRSLERVNSIIDSRIRVVSKLNEGVSTARNLGIQYSQYPWVAFLDADDLWVHDKLDITRNAILENVTSKWIISGYYLSKNSRIRSIIYNANGILPDVIDDLIRGLKIHTSSVVVRKDVFDDEGFLFTEGINNSEDRELWYKLACRYKNPVYINQALAFYNVDDSGTSLTGLVTKGKMENFHFLSLEDRLRPILGEISKDRAERMCEYIKSNNFNSIVGYWIRNRRKIPLEFKPHLISRDFRLFNATRLCPKILKRIIIKVRKKTLK